MTEREDLELKRGPAPEGSEKRRPKSGQKVPGRESKKERQLSLYQSDRILREPQQNIYKMLMHLLRIRAPLIEFVGHAPKKDLA